MFLIASAGYVEMQLRAEIGDIPPTFLPLGNRRLFEHQLELVRGRTDVVMSLPRGFVLPQNDEKLLRSLGVTVVCPPDGLSLAASIAWCIKECDRDGSIEILHGDTLFDELPGPAEGEDAVSVVSTSEHYDWAAVERLRNGRLRIRQQFGGGSASQVVLSGWFRFSSSERLADALVKSNSFIAAIERYSMEENVELVSPPAWRDVGHVSTYLRVRADHTRERAFNKLESDTVSISKTGPRQKIVSEALWYQELPAPLRVYTPTFLGMNESDERVEYHLEYLYLLTLSDLFVFGALPAPVWSVIFRAAEEALSKLRMVRPPSLDGVNPTDLLLPKTLERLETFAREGGLQLDVEHRINGKSTPSLLRIAEEAASAIAPLESAEISLIHGDPCFSNVFFDFRSERVKLVDPRGIDARGQTCFWGDPRYDIAKLAHSAFGFYDLIVSDRFELTVESLRNFSFRLDSTPEMLGARAEFLKSKFGSWAGNDRSVEGMVVLLFLSMLPLHSDKPNRQLAFVANALALHHRLEHGEDPR